MGWLWISLYHALAMLWETFWALVLGFSLSAVLQVFVSKEQMTRSFGRAGLREVALATGLGAASSSCSYAAVAAAKTAFKKGAALVPVLAFMFASTNLVFELGAVLWLLMGWLFVLAEVIGAFVLIGVMWLIVRVTLPKSLENEARHHVESAEASASCHNDSGHEQEIGKGKWTSVASAFAMDVSMLWKELIAGFLIAGFLSALVPETWWRTLFLSGGPDWLRLIENAIVGPIIAIASFVCSIGNIPLASILWSSGISFGGVISFIYADLIVIPLILIYGKYYGLKAASYIVTVLFVSMVLAGIIVDLVFSALHLIPSSARPANPVSHAMIAWNYTSWLDLVALVVGGCLLFLHLRDRSSHSIYHAHH
jgi:uncharacterized protein